MSNIQGPTPRCWPAALLGGLLLSAPACAQTPSSPPGSSPAPVKSAATITAPSDQRPVIVSASAPSSVRPGGTFQIVLELAIAPGWHLYWRGQNDTGLPVHIRWDLPAGLIAGEPIWPKPTRHVSPGDLLDYVYTGRLRLIVPVEVDASVRGPQTLGAKLDWQVCAAACKLGQGEAGVSVRVEGPQAPAQPASTDDAVMTPVPDASVPPTAPAGVSVRTERRGDTLRITASGVRRLAFYPDADGAAMLDPIAQGITDGTELLLHFHPDDRAKPIIGILDLAPGEAGPAYRVNIPPESAGTSTR